MTLTQETMDKYFRACAQPQSNYALEYLVDGGQLTPERRFKQAVMELGAAQQNLREGEYRLEELRIDLDETVHDMRTAAGSMQDTFEYRRSELKRQKLMSDIELLERGLSGKRKEMNVHLNMLKRYQEELGFTDSTTEEEVYKKLEAAEADHYITKLAMDVAANYVAHRGGPSHGVTLALQQLASSDLARAMRIVGVMVPQMMENKYTDALHSPEGVKALERMGEQLQSIAIEEARKTQDHELRSVK